MFILGLHFQSAPLVEHLHLGWAAMFSCTTHEPSRLTLATAPEIFRTLLDPTWGSTRRMAARL